ATRRSMSGAMARSLKRGGGSLPPIRRSLEWFNQRSKFGSVSKDARRVPGVVGAAGEVVAEIAVRAGDRAPMARGVAPGIDTGEGRLKHVLAADNPPP